MLAGIVRCLGTEANSNRHFQCHSDSDASCHVVIVQLIAGSRTFKSQLRQTFDSTKGYTEEDMDTNLRLVILFAFIGCSAAIKCYDCQFSKKMNLVYGPKNCDDEFEAHNISTRECGGVCQKKKVFPVPDNEDDNYQMYRSCANVCEKSDYDEIDCCEGDLCNAASPSAIYSFAFVLVSSAVAFVV